jgi:hypothetical protein
MKSLRVRQVKANAPRRAWPVDGRLGGMVFGG